MVRYKKRSYRPRRAPSQALRNIEEAKQFTKEIGGTDKDVKKWLFSLSDEKLQPIMDAYKKEFGLKAHDYAIEAIPKWRTEETKMSGMVAQRLYKLLPNFMSLNDKYKLVETLWNHVGPSRARLIETGPQSDVDDVIQTLRTEVLGLATNWELPNTLHKRFSWLGNEDSTVYKQLLAHIKERELQMAVEILEEQVPIIQQNYANNWQEVSSHISYIVELGKQRVELRILPDISIISVSDWRPAMKNDNKSSNEESNVPWILIGIIILLIIIFS